MNKWCETTGFQIPSPDLKERKLTNTEHWSLSDSLQTLTHKSETCFVIDITSEYTVERIGLYKVYLLGHFISLLIIKSFKVFLFCFVFLFYYYYHLASRKVLIFKKKSNANHCIAESKQMILSKSFDLHYMTDGQERFGLKKYPNWNYCGNKDT